MRKSPILYFGLFICVLLITIFFCSCTNGLSRRVYLKGICLKVEIADSSVQRQQGLMFRKSIAEDQGMFFIFEKEDIHSFWMKNMQFPLDIIWIGRNKKIVDIYPGALPCKDICKGITPAAAAKFALEVNSGFVEKNNIKAGDVLTLTGI